MTTRKRAIPPVPKHFVKRIDDTFAIIRREAAQGYTARRYKRSTGLLTALLTVVLLATAALAATNGGILKLFDGDKQMIENSAPPLTRAGETPPPPADYEGAYVTVRVEQAVISPRELVAVWTIKNKSGSLLHVAEPVYAGLNGLRLIDGYIIVNNFERWLQPGEIASYSMRWILLDEPVLAINEFVVSLRISRSLSGVEQEQPRIALYDNETFSYTSGVASYVIGEQFEDYEPDLEFAEAAVFTINIALD